LRRGAANSRSLKAQIRVVDHILAGRRVPRLRAVAVPGELVFMSENIVSIFENEHLGSVTVNAVDALDREIDAVWGLIAIIEVIHREIGGDHYASGALRVAHNHLDALIAIRQNLGRI
jgi:hypothetical protein